MSSSQGVLFLRNVNGEPKWFKIGYEKIWIHLFWKTFTDGKYIGGFKNGEKHGQGIETLTNGEEYVGEFRYGNYHGQGTLTFVSSFYAPPPPDLHRSAVYYGDYKDGKMHGQGTYVWSKADYVGEFNDGKRNGQGTITWSDGKMYVGEWKDGFQHGQGSFTFSDGREYEGEFKDGKPYGQGTWTFSDGRKFVGEFKKETQHGQGKFTLPDGGEYEGEFKDGKPNGQGTLTYSDGEKYVGEFKDGKFHGQGSMNMSNGVIYSCKWKDGVWDGNGIAIIYLKSLIFFKLKWLKFSNLIFNNIIFNNKYKIIGVLFFPLMAISYGLGLLTLYESDPEITLAPNNNICKKDINHHTWEVKTADKAYGLGYPVKIDYEIKRKDDYETKTWGYFFEAEIRYCWIDDFDSDNKTEIILSGWNEGTGVYGKLNVFEFNGNELKAETIPGPDDSLKECFAGADHYSYSSEEKTIYHSFPLKREKGYTPLFCFDGVYEERILSFDVQDNIWELFEEIDYDDNTSINIKDLEKGPQDSSTVLKKSIIPEELLPIVDQFSMVVEKIWYKLLRKTLETLLLFLNWVGGMID